MCLAISLNMLLGITRRMRVNGILARNTFQCAQQSYLFNSRCQNIYLQIYDCFSGIILGHHHVLSIFRGNSFLVIGTKLNMYNLLS